MRWFAKAPSNIALIKYMGKKNYDTNVPDNPSLSYTLPHLISDVEIETQAGDVDSWEPLNKEDQPPLALSSHAQARFLKHLNFLKAQFNYSGAFIVRSCNNFPHSSGFASSASSFAALTQCAILALSELTKTPCPDIETQAQLSRQGSGSSCRSFFSPWALWSDETVKAIDLPFMDLHHEVIVIDQNEKDVSSSEAHKRIKNNLHYSLRPERAAQHLNRLLAAFERKDWMAAYHVCWDEFQDMHQLFSTCAEPFSYITDKSQAALNALQALWQLKGDGPLITMDAGPNIHLLYRNNQSKLASQFKADLLASGYEIL